MINRENFINIQGWMVTDLRLKGNELLIYAIIYGFSQDGDSKFEGSASYLAEWTNSTKQGIYKALKSLIDKGLIIKEEEFKNNLKLVNYRSTKFTGVVNKVYRGGKQSLPGGSKQSLPHNIDINNIEDNIIDIRKNKFSKPSIDEIKEYCLERNNQINAEQFYDYYESKGWMIGKNKMKDWKAAIRTWERNGFSKEEIKPKNPYIAAEDDPEIQEWLRSRK